VPRRDCLEGCTFGDYPACLADPVNHGVTSRSDLILASLKSVYRNAKIFPFPSVAPIEGKKPRGSPRQALRVQFGKPACVPARAFRIDVFKSGQLNCRISPPRQRVGKISQSLVACSAPLTAQGSACQAQHRPQILYDLASVVHCAGLSLSCPIACSKSRSSSFETRCNPSVKPSLRFNRRLIKVSPHFFQLYGAIAAFKFDSFTGRNGLA